MCVAHLVKRLPCNHEDLSSDSAHLPKREGSDSSTGGRAEAGGSLEVADPLVEPDGVLQVQGRLSLKN